jgi:hypothetical protein
MSRLTKETFERRFLPAFQPSGTPEFGRITQQWRTFGLWRAYPQYYGILMKFRQRQGILRMQTTTKGIRI